MKQMRCSFSLLMIICLSNIVSAQKTDFLSKGKILFEKKVNIYAQMQELFKENDQNQSWIDNIKDYFKKESSQFLTREYSLTFEGDKTLFQSTPREDDKSVPWFIYNDEDNVTYSDLGKSESTRLRHVYEDFFLVTDSTRKVDWKITNETREIAGIHCRRANAVIMDSVYVVAFYTDDILTSGGPEGFNGLPGMILGIALPYDHITWFATKVMTDDKPSSKQILPPSQGKKMNNKTYVEALQSAFKTWGNRGKIIIKTTQF